MTPQFVTLSNPYVRSGIAAGSMFVLVLCRLLQTRGVNWASEHATLIVLLLGLAMAITAVIVGTISRKSDKPWPWVLVGAVTLGCGVLAMYVILFMQKLVLQ